MKLLNRVQFATGSTGASDIAVGAPERSAALGDMLTPAEAGAVDGDILPYFIVDGANFATGRGVYSATGPTLIRDAAERRWNGSTFAAGKLALSGGAKVYVEAAGEALLLRPGVLSQASAAALTPDIVNYSTFRFTALAAGLTINAPTTTPYDGQRVRFEFTDDNTARSLAWNGAWASSIAAVPTTTGGRLTAGFLTVAEFVYSAARGKFLCVLAAVEAPVKSLGFVGRRTIASGAGASMVLPLTGLTGGSSTSPAAGDFALLALAMASTSDQDMAAAARLASAGWTLHQELYSPDTNGTNLAVYYKTLPSTPDASVSINATPNADWGHAAGVLVFSGVDPVTPFDVPSQTVLASNGGSVNPAAITPANPDALIAVLGGAADASLTTFTNPGDLDHFFSATLPGTIDAAIGVGYKDWTSGAFDPAAWANTNTANGSAAALTCALRPAALN